MHLKPHYGRVVVKRLAPESESAGGIVIPDAAQARSRRGTVLATSGWTDANGTVRMPDVQVGDEVLFPEFAGEEFAIGAEKYLLIKHDDLMACVVG